MENKLKKMMQKKNIRVVDLVRLTKIHYSKISRIRHDVERPTDLQKHLLAKALKCSIGELFPPDESDNEPRTVK